MNEQIAEALRYMGAREADARTVALAEAGFAAFSDIQPRHVLRVFRTVELLEAFESRTLAEHLRGTEEAALLAATLGSEADRRILRAEATDTLLATALHACAAVRIETHCDAVQASLTQARRPRFSPGYGDFALSKQAALLRLTEAGKRIGLFLTDGYMLAPVKSVTAVLGFGPALEECPTDKCARCEKGDCVYRGEKSVCN